MPADVTLANFAEQGMKDIKDTTKRAEACKKTAKARTTPRWRRWR